MPALAGARIAFAGTPEFAAPCLEMLLAEGAEVPIVLTQPDRPAGRGRRLTGSPVKSVAERAGLRIEQPARLADRAACGWLGERPDILLVIAYGLLLPGWVLEWPRLGCINMHASLLPRWRGAAPIQRAILAGDAVTGISVMRMDRGLDTGPVYSMHETPIRPDDTAASLHDRLSRLAAEAGARMLPRIIAGDAVATPQPAQGATYAPKLTKQEAALDWRRPAAELERCVRAFNPWPVAEGRLANGERLRIWQARVVRGGADGSPGAIIGAGQHGIDVATGSGLLRIEILQPPGGRAMPAGAYLAAHRLDGLAFDAAGG